ncbi:MAG: caspase family protein [Desulfamplus sp.]|nr:caspase family protein [Desulfamplus sp.]
MKKFAKRDKFNIKLVCNCMLVLFFLLSITCENAIAFRPSSIITKAVRQNIRQAIKPTFKVTSRYSKPMGGVAFSTDGLFFATVSGSGSVQVWNTKDGQKIQDLYSNNGAITITAFSQDSNYIATGTKKGDIDLWSLRDQSFHKTISIGSGAISSLIAIAQQGGWLASTSQGSVKLVDISLGTIKRTYSSSEMNDTLCLSLNRKGDRVITGHANGTIRIWDFFSAKNILTIDGKEGAVYSIDTSVDDVLAAGLESGKVELWNLATGKKIFSEKRHNSSVKAVVITHNSKYVATGSDDGLIKISPVGNKSEIVLAGHEGSVNSICFNQNDNFLLSASSDKTTRFWDWRQNKEAARIIVMREGWAVVTPEGFFDGTLYGEEEDTLESVQWAVEKSAYSVDKFLTYYYEPALLGYILQGKIIKRVQPVEDISNGFQLPPLLTLSTGSISGSGQSENRAVIEVIVEAVDQGGGIDEIRLYHNKKALGEFNIKSVVQKKDKVPHQVKTYLVDLVDGENQIKAVAFSHTRIESEAVDKTVFYSSPVDHMETTLHMVGIGINQYKDENIKDLDYSVADAQGILKAIERVHSKDFDVYNYYELYDKNATLSNINSLFYSLQNLPPQDTVFIYFAGHGVVDKNEWYFLPHDTSEDFANKGLSSSILTSRTTNIGARQILLLIDACQSGAIIDAFKDQKVFALLSRLSGIHLAAATTKEQLAFELIDLGHGLFTFTFLEGIKGNADQLPIDGNISVKEALNYIKVTMPILLKKYNLSDQKPMINLVGIDFMLVDSKK